MVFDGYEQYEFRADDDRPQPAGAMPDLTITRENGLDHGREARPNEIILGMGHLDPREAEAPPIARTTDRYYNYSRWRTTETGPLDKPDDAGSTPGDLPPPSVSPEQDTPAKETLWHVEAIKYDKRNNEVLNHPVQGSITSALRAGEPLEFTVTRDKPDGPFHYKASEALLPPRPTAKPPEESRPSTDTNAPAGQEQAPRQQYGFWSRIAFKMRTSSVDQTMQAIPQQAREEMQQGGIQPAYETQLENLAQNYSQGGYTVKFIAEPIPPEEHDAIDQDIKDALHNAQQTRSQARAEMELQIYQLLVDSAFSTTAQRTHVVVGATDPETLASVTRTVQDKVLPTSSSTWQADGTTYPSEEQARAAGRNDFKSIGGVEQFGNLIVYPEKGVHGLRCEQMHEFAKHRPIPPGTEAIAFGKIIDHEDHNGNVRYAGEVKAPEGNDHWLVIGASRHGKTVTARKLIANKTVAAYERSQAAEARGETPTPYVNLIVDNEKIGNYANQISQLVQAEGVPPESGFADVYLVSPGPKKPGVWANFDILRPSGDDTPREQVMNVKTAIGSTVEHPEAQRVLSKFGGMAYAYAASQNGFNMATGQPSHPHGDPAHVDADQFKTAIEEVIASSSFKKETQGDIGGYTKSQVEDLLRGLAGQLFTGGYPVDHSKLADVRGSLVTELGRLGDPIAKRFAMTALYQGQIAERRRRHPDGDIHHTEATLVQDETSGLYDRHTPAGAFNGHAYTMIGGLGVDSVNIQQGRLDELHPDVLVNTAHTIAFHTKNLPDREVLEGRGMEGTDYLTTAPKLRGLYIGSNMPEGPVNFATPLPDMNELARYEPIIKSPEAILDRGTDTEFHDGLIKEEAKDRLLNTHLGARIFAWADMGAVTTMTGHRLTKLGEPPSLPPKLGKQTITLKDELQAMTGREAKIRDVMIETAAAEVFASRADIGYAANTTPRVSATEYLRDNLLAQARGEPLPEGPPRLDLALDMGYYNYARDPLIDRLTAGGTYKEEYDKAFGGAGGATAAEQLDALGQKERASFELVKNAVANGFVSPGASAELGKLLGGATGEIPAPPELLEEISTTLNYTALPLPKPGHEGIGYIRQELQKRLGVATLGVEQEEAFTKLLAGIPGDDPTAGVGYAAMRRDLTRAIVERYLSAPAVEMKDLEAAYGETFDGATARDQLKAISERHEARIRNSSYREKIPEIMTNVLFAHDRKRGGFIIDNNIQRLGEEGDRGEVYDAQAANQNQGRMPESSLVAQLNRNDPRVSRWAGLMADKLLLSDDFALPPALSRYLVNEYSRHLSNLRERARTGGEAKDQQMTRLAAMLGETITKEMKRLTAKLGETATKEMEKPGDPSHGQ